VVDIETKLFVKRKSPDNKTAKEYKKLREFHRKFHRGVSTITDENYRNCLDRVCSKTHLFWGSRDEEEMEMEV
jgi:ERCC4-type nuclease